MNQKNVKFTPDCLKRTQNRNLDWVFLDQRGILYLLASLAGKLYSAPFFRLDWKVKCPTETNLLFSNGLYD